MDINDLRRKLKAAAEDMGDKASAIETLESASERDETAIEDAVNRRDDLEVKYTPATQNYFERVKVKLKQEAITFKFDIYPINDRPYRDYRYGSAFIWNYEVFSPELKSVINLERKTPEYFFDQNILPALQ